MKLPDRSTRNNTIMGGHGAKQRDAALLSFASLLLHISRYAAVGHGCAPSTNRETYRISGFSVAESEVGGANAPNILAAPIDFLVPSLLSLIGLLWMFG